MGFVFFFFFPPYIVILKRTLYSSSFGKMCDCLGKVFLKNGKTQNALSPINFEIYRVVDPMHGIKKIKFKQ